jgi:hypothetical protein
MYGLSSVCGYAVIESNTHDSLIEANLIIITGCLPTMRLFFRHVTPRLIGEQSARGHSHNPGTKYGTNSKPLQVELKEISVKRTRVYDRMVDEDAISMGSALKTETGWQGDTNSVRAVILQARGAIIETETAVLESKVTSGNGKNGKCRNFEC